jgi:hypothetical protein
VTCGIENFAKKIQVELETMTNQAICAEWGFELTTKHRSKHAPATTSRTNWWHLLDIAYFIFKRWIHIKIGLHRI